MWNSSLIALRECKLLGGYPKHTFPSPTPSSVVYRTAMILAIVVASAAAHAQAEVDPIYWTA